MRASQQHLPSISLVLSQASSLMQMPGNHPKFLSQKPTLMPPVRDMQTADERDHVSLIFQGASAYLLQHNVGLVNLRDALGTKEDDAPIRGRRLSLSSLVIDLAHLLKRRYYRFHAKKCGSEADLSIPA